MKCKPCRPVLGRQGSYFLRELAVSSGRNGGLWLAGIKKKRYNIMV
ncbi:hypothetical protein BACCAP_03746 [Pseudoflavonifractor capillosus ATCC 29799]|uniref:Uncharacterized protein n=1 Tax=Pseudoflavonifractor capillosus ATCC 29799 TaxID=411467 RepID=A6NZU2_9FIRM|nr:hypothetical protein BACCAP_03746 [Pseudoflavonifractor capillosus ATCC 29799]